VKYQVDRVEVLRAELAEVASAFAELAGRGLEPIDAELKKRSFPPIGPTLPPR
jgi:hypothetical protein